MKKEKSYLEGMEATIYRGKDSRKNSVYRASTVDIRVATLVTKAGPIGGDTDSYRSGLYWRRESKDIESVRVSRRMKAFPGRGGPGY